VKIGAEPLTMTVEEAALVLGIARSTAYELVRAGDIDSIRLRRRIVVPVARLAERLGVSPADVWSVLRPNPPSPSRDRKKTPDKRTSSADTLTLF
jgi:excisionase family DNA binding protein